MAKLPVLSWIGNAFAALCGKHGDVTAQAQAAGCSRQTVYDHGVKVQQVVRDAQLPGPSRATLLADNQRLLQEIQCLRQQLAQLQRRLADAVVLTPDKKHRLAVTTHAMGLSFNQIEDVFALLLAAEHPDTPARRGPDRVSIARWVLRHAKQAGPLLGVLDEHTRPLAEVLAPDEIFFHRQPVLMGVEPASMALLLCQRAKDRKGPTWQQALLPFTRLSYAICDQGSGLQAGLDALRRSRLAARDQQKPAQDAAKAVPALENGLDVFHIEKEARPVRARIWRKVKKRWDKWERAQQRLQQAQQRTGDGRKYAPTAQAAWREVERYWGWYERLESAWQRAKAALKVYRPDGRLNDREHAQAESAAACGVLVGPAWAKVRRLLSDPRTLTFLDRLHRQLAEAEPNGQLREVLVRLWGLEHGRRTGPRLGTAVVLRLACARLAGDWATAYSRVGAVLGGVVRASSAVECVNSILRMQQARQRNLSQEMLDLKRLYWNCRPFRSGKRRGKCPYQLLGASLPTYDFWDLLRMDPAQLRQQLSSQRVAA
jgi:hypothetical protein